MIREYRRRLRVNRMRDQKTPVIQSIAYIAVAFYIAPIGIYLAYALLTQ